MAFIPSGALQKWRIELGVVAHASYSQNLVLMQGCEVKTSLGCVRRSCLQKPSVSVNKMESLL